MEIPHHAHGTQVLEGSCAKAAAQTLETKLASGMGGVESGGGVQANTSSVSQSHQCVSPAQAELSLQGKGSCSPSVLLAGGSQMSVCLWDSSDLRVCHMLSSISPASSCFYGAEVQFVASKVPPGV